MIDSESGLVEEGVVFSTPGDEEHRPCIKAVLEGSISVTNGAAAREAGPTR